MNNGTLHVSGGGILGVLGSWTNNGIVRLGRGPALQSNADYTQASTGKLLAEIGSSGGDGHGKTIVTGTATLGGLLRLEFGDSFVLAAGPSFAALEYANRIGTFDSIEATGLDTGLQIVPSYGGSSLTVTIVAE